MVTSLPQADISWKKDNILIEPSENISIEAKGNVKVLIIKKTQQEDTGLYTVTATNEAGEDSCSANLSVKGKKNRYCTTRAYLLLRHAACSPIRDFVVLSILAKRQLHFR